MPQPHTGVAAKLAATGSLLFALFMLLLFGGILFAIGWVVLGA